MKFELELDANSIILIQFQHNFIGTYICSWSGALFKKYYYINFKDYF